MSDTIKEVTGFSADITLRSLVDASGAWKVDSIVVADPGSGGLVLQGTAGEETTLTGLIAGETITLNGVKKILAAGTTVDKLRVTFTRLS